MNWLINALAALLVVVLAALAFGPYLVDWTEFRAAIAANATRAFGTEVAIGGDVSVGLLPSPRLVVSDLRVGPADAPLLTAERAELDVSLTPLLNRELHVNELRLARPTLTLRLDARGALALPARSRPGDLASWLDARRVVVDDVAVEDGTAIVTDARTGTERTLSGIALAGTARSLAGPFNASGTVPLRGRPAALTVQGGALADGLMPLSLRLAPADGPTATLDGRLAVDPAAPALSGRLRVAGTAALPFGLEADLSLDPRRIELSAASATFGAAATPLDVTARATWALSGREPLAIAVEARQIDFDRIERALSAPPADPAAPAAPPVAHPPAEMLPRLAAAFAPAAETLRSLAGVALTVDIDVTAVLAGGSVVRDVSADLATGAGGLIIRRAEALLPGDTQAEASGRFADRAFAGHVRINAPQPAALARWWHGRPDTASAPALLAEADVDAAAGRFDARRLSLRIGGTAANGRVRWSADGGGNLDASLGAPLVDLADLSAAAALVPAPPGATTVTLNLAADRLRLGDLEGGAATARADYRGGTLTLSSLSAADLAGTTLFASGTLRDLSGTPSGSIDGTVSVSDGAALASAIGRLLPPGAVRVALARTAAAAAPAELRLSLAGGTAAPLALTLAGTAAGTTLDIAAAGDPLGNWRGAPLRLSATLANPDGRVLLRQLGRPGGEDGAPGRLGVSAEGVPATGLAVRAAGAAVGAELSFDGTLALADAASLAGAAGARIPRLDAFGAALGVPLPAAAVTADATVAGPATALTLSDLAGSVDGVPVRGNLTLGDRVTGRLDAESLDLSRLAALVLGPAPLAGADGRWSTAAFAPAAPPPRPLALALSARRAPPLTDLRTDLALDEAGLRLSGLSAAWGGGRVSGAATLERDGAAARLSARTQLEGVQLATVAWASGGAPVATGLLRLDADVSARAFTASGLVQGLRGRGRLEVFDGTLALNPRPFDLPLAVLDAPEPPDEATARALFAAHLDSGSLAFSRLSAALAIDAGVVRLDGLTLTPAPALRFADVALDLEGWRVRGAATVPSAFAGSAATPLAVTFDGPLGAPVRRIDAGALATWIGLRRLERQVEAVEADNRALEAEALGRPAPPPPPPPPPPPAATPLRFDGPAVPPFRMVDPPAAAGSAGEDYRRSVEALDAALSDYERRRADRRAAEDALRTRFAAPAR